LKIGINFALAFGNDTDLSEVNI